MNTVPTKPTTGPADVLEVTQEVSALVNALERWQAGETDTETGTTYVSAGHEAVDAIDAALRHLHTLRERLISDIRRDGRERDERVDLLLAQIRGDRGMWQTSREDLSEAGQPVPANVDGYAVGGGQRG